MDPFFLFSPSVGCPGLCPSSWRLSGGDGGRSSCRRRPGLGGDGGPWHWLFVVVMVGTFFVSVIRWAVVVVYVVVVVAAVASKILKSYVSTNKIREKTYLGPMRRRRRLIGPFFFVFVVRPGPCPSSWRLSGGDGGRSSRCHRRGDGGPSWWWWWWWWWLSLLLLLLLLFVRCCGVAVGLVKKNLS
jgi:hypothetical protein